MSANICALPTYIELYGSIKKKLGNMYWPQRRDSLAGEAMLIQI